MQLRIVCSLLIFVFFIVLLGLCSYLVVGKFMKFLHWKLELKLKERGCVLVTYVLIIYLYVTERETEKK